MPHFNWTEYVSKKYNKSNSIVFNFGLFDVDSLDWPNEVTKSEMNQFPLGKIALIAEL